MQDKTYWNGTIWGTNKGATLVELERQGVALIGNFVFIEPGLGTTRARISGSWSDANIIDANLDQFTSEYSVPIDLPRSGQLHGLFDPSLAVIQGDWKTSVGTHGNFVLVFGPKIEPPVMQPKQAQLLESSTVSSEQPAGPLVTTTVNIGAVRLDQEGLTNLAQVIKDGTLVNEVAINASHRGREYIHLRLSWTKAVNTRVFLHKKIVPFHIKYAEWILTPLAVLFSGIIAYLIQRYVHAQ